MNSDLVIGIDCSTTAVKAIAYDLFGQPVAAGRAALDIRTPRPGFYEQSAEDWWSAACQALRQVLRMVAPDRIRALAVAHQRETFVPMGADLTPLRPAILWMDQRAHTLLPHLAISLDAERFRLRTGKPFSANLAPPKIEWLRLNEPEVYRTTAYWMDTHAYLIFKFTGRVATSSGSADPMGLYDCSTDQWDAIVLDALHLDPASMPLVSAPGTQIGLVTSQAEADTGLPAGTPVAAGLGDGQAAMLGLGINTEGVIGLSLGTSVIGGCFSPTFKTSTAFRTMTGPSGGYILETVLLSGTLILDWLARDLLGSPEPSRTLAELEEASSSIPAGSAGLVLVPYWNGAMNPYWDPSASGILVGLRGHHRAAHIFRAALEGVAFEVRLHLEGLESAISSPIRELVVSGGGSNNLLWLQIIADVTGKPVYRKEETEATALGAAMLAALSAGFYPDTASVVPAMASAVHSRYVPSPAAHDFYTRIFTTSYRPLYPAIQTHIHMSDYQD